MNTLIDVAVADGRFKALAKALTAAGPVTVFATSDDAFAKIPKAVLDALLKDKVTLKSAAAPAPPP